MRLWATVNSFSLAKQPQQTGLTRNTSVDANVENWTWVQVELSVEDQCRIRDRSTIMARQLYAERGEGFADGQVRCAQTPLLTWFWSLSETTQAVSHGLHSCAFIMQSSASLHAGSVLEGLATDATTCKQSQNSGIAPQQDVYHWHSGDRLSC